MLKKGVSPLVATVLIIVIIFAIGATIFTFYQGFVQKKGGETSKLNSLSNYCLYGIKLDVEKVCDLNGNIKLTIANDGVGSVDKIKYTLSAISGEKEGELDGIGNLSLNHYTIVTGWHPGETERLILVPYIDDNGIEGECSRIEFTKIKSC